MNPSANKFLDRTATLAFVLIALGVCGLIGVIKISSFSAWNYVSDLFTYDTMLQEILRGHPGLEFTFGNSFGDHAYLYLFLLLPFKLLLQNHMVMLLLLLTPMACCLYALVLFYAFKEQTCMLAAFLLAGVALLGYRYHIQGMYEAMYGFHPDTLSGYCASAFVTFLIWYRARKSRQLSGRWQLAGFWICFLVFLLLKEEMALLACLFFLGTALILRDRLNLAGLAISTGVSVLDFALIKICQTPFNRTNEALITTLLSNVRENGPKAFLTHIPAEFALLLAVYVFIFCMLVAFSKQKNWYAIFLAAIGLLKVAFGLASQDFDPTTWHNFPGLVMILTAILWQLTCLRPISARTISWLASGAFLIALLSFLRQDVPLFWNRYQDNQHLIATNQQLSAELFQLQRSLDPSRIIAIPPKTEAAWMGFRYAFFPRGVTMSPEAIADYVVYPQNFPDKYMSRLQVTRNDLRDTFTVIGETPHFVLLKRTGIAVSQIPIRDYFYQTFGLTNSLP